MQGDEIQNSEDTEDTIIELVDEEFRYTFSGFSKGEVLRVTFPARVGLNVLESQFARGQERQISAREYAIFLNIVLDKEHYDGPHRYITGNLRTWLCNMDDSAPNLGTLVLSGWDNSTAVSRAVDFDDQYLLNNLIKAGHIAHSSNPFQELIFDLNCKTDDPLVLGARQGWIQGSNRQAPLPLSNQTEVPLEEIMDYLPLQTLFEESIDFIDEMFKWKRGDFFNYESLTAKDLICNGVTPESGKFIVRPTVVYCCEEGEDAVRANGDFTNTDTLTVEKLIQKSPRKK